MTVTVTRKRIKAAANPKPLVVSGAIQKEAGEAKQALTLISNKLTTLEVSDEVSYSVADEILGHIQEKRKWWAGKIRPAIDPIRQGLDALYELNRSIDGPMGQAEELVKGKMKHYKLEEARKLRELEEAKRAEADRIRREAEEIAKKEANAKTAQMRERLAARRQELEATATAIEEEETPQPVQTSNSQTRNRLKWDIEDFMTFVKAVAAKKVPIQALTVDATWVNQYFKLKPEEVMEWPGVKVEEDVTIVGQRR